MSKKSHLVADLEVFVAVATLGSLAAAAPILRRSPSTLSRQLTRLEAAYGTTLIRRTTRSASLTDSGLDLLQRAKEVLTQLDQLGDGLTSSQAVPSGRVRLSAPTTLGETLVAPTVRALVRAYPNLEVSLDLSNRFVDLTGEGYDAVIRIASKLDDSGLRARKLGLHPTHLYRRPGAAPIDAPPSLQEHEALALAHGPNRRTWTLSNGNGSVKVRPRSRFSSSSLQILMAAAVEGLGIAALPAYLAAPRVESGQLERVLPSWSLPLQSVWMLHAGTRSAALDSIAVGVSERLQQLGK